MSEHTPSELLRPATPGLREALEGLTQEIPNYHALSALVREHVGPESSSVLPGVPLPVARWIAQEMLRWCDDEELSKRITLEEYACALAGVMWPPPTFIHPTAYLYLNLPTVLSESLNELRDFAAAKLKELP